MQNQIISISLVLRPALVASPAFAPLLQGGFAGRAEPCQALALAAFISPGGLSPQGLTVRENAQISEPR